mmetsp:Transcript_15449/g.21946  ORF Transcript_15449/g.21946 Transcript_15449/m.21946 type:complete len:103 (-) Transcript_15449:177-485(-)
MNAATPNTAASTAMIIMVGLVAASIEEEGEDKSSRTSPKTKFIMQKDKPTEDWMIIPVKMISLSWVVPWRKRERKGIGLASAYLSMLSAWALEEGGDGWGFC